MDIGIAGIIASLIIAFGSVVSSVIFSLVPRQRKEKIYNLQKELYDVYLGVLQYKKLEESLEEQLKLSKQKARIDVDIPERFEMSRLHKRIKQLENKLS